LFEILEHDIDYFSEYGNIFITGDMNSRVGEKLDFIVHDSVNNITDDNLYAPDCTSVRASVDKGRLCFKHTFGGQNICACQALRNILEDN